MSLESRYRRLLRMYPRSYRDRRGEEMLATLLDSAGPAQTRPSRRDVADLIGGAARERLGLHTVAGLAPGLRVAAPVFLVIAAAFATSDWLSGTRTSPSTVVAAVWLLAVLARLALPRTNAAPVGLAWLATVAASAWAGTHPERIDLGEGNVISEAAPGRFVPALVCGLIALVGFVLAEVGPGTADLARSRVADNVPNRIAVVVAVLGLDAATALADGVGRRPALGSTYLLYPSWTRLLWLLPIAVALTGLAVYLRRRDTGWLWAAMLLLLPVPLSVNWANGLLIIRDPGLWWPYFTVGGYGQVVLVGVLIAVTVYLAAQNRATTSPGGLADGRSALVAAGALAQGATVAVCGYIVAAASYQQTSVTDIVLLATIAVIAAAALVTPIRLHRPLIGLALGGVVIAEYSGRTIALRSMLVAAIGALLIVILASWGDRDRGEGTAGRAASRTRIKIAAAGALATAGLLPLQAWLDSSEPFGAPYSSYLQHTIVPAVVVSLLLPVVGWAAVAVVRTPHGWIAAAVAFIASLLWTDLVFGPFSDSRVIAAMLGLAVLGAVTIRLLRRRGARTASPATA